MARYSTRKYTPNDVKKLMEAARALYLPKPKVEDVRADWLLEGGLGSTVWKTQNAGHEHLEDGVWKGTKDVNFAHQLPNGSLLTDPENEVVLHALQRWAFALRTGLLGYFPGPRAWQKAVRWVLNLTSWMYLRSDELHPQKYGFELIDIENLKQLIQQLSIDGWSEALQLTTRAFNALHMLTYGRPPTAQALSLLPHVDAKTINDVINKLRTERLYKDYTNKSESLICRAFLGRVIFHKMEGFRSRKIRRFLRQFELGLADQSLLLRGKTLTNHPSSKSHLIDDIEDHRTPEKTMASHAMQLIYFIAGHKLDKSRIPAIEISTTDIIKEASENTEASQHQRLIPINDGLSLLREASRWIVKFGDQVIKIYLAHLENCKTIDNCMTGAGYTILAAEKSKSFSELVKSFDDSLSGDSDTSSIIEFAGLNSAFKKYNRDIQPGNLTLSQAVYILIGACAYAIGMIKPMREGELESIPYNCIIRNTLNKGCWIKAPNEKSAELGYQEVLGRPIPYLTYRAVFLLQQLGRLTATHFFGKAAVPSRLFYFPSGNDGMSPPTKRISNGALGVAIGRCMDYFCDYLNLDLDEHGRRQYYRIHELRKFFLLTLSWNDPYHGDECGAWMAGHRDDEYLQAYTDANIDGAELSALEARYIESKIIEVESSGGTAAESETTTTYRKILKELKVDSISGLPPEKFTSYVRNAVESGHLSAKLIKIRSIVPGDVDYTDLAVIIGKEH